MSLVGGVVSPEGLPVTTPTNTSCKTNSLKQYFQQTNNNQWMPITIQKLKLCHYKKMHHSVKCKAKTPSIQT